MNETRLLRRIDELAAGLPAELVLRLFWIRLASRSFQPGMLQLSLFDERETTPWDIVLQGQTGSFDTAIGLALFKMGFDVSEDAFAPISQEDEKKLPELLWLLSQMEVPEGPVLDAPAYQAFVQKNPSVSAGGFVMPRELAQLLAQLVQVRDGKVCDPCCTSGALLAAAARESKRHGARTTLYGQVPAEKALDFVRPELRLCNLRAALSAASENALIEDALPYKRYDFILTNPPFNLFDKTGHWWNDMDPRWKYSVPPRGRANFAWLQHVLYHLEPKGRAAVLMPNGTLTSGLHAEASIRSGLVADGHVEAIITFPKKLFSGTEAAFCLWLLRKEPGEDVLFLDAARLLPEIHGKLLPEHVDFITERCLRHRLSEPIEKGTACAVASLDEIKQQQFVLSPNLYLKSLQPLRIRSSMTDFQTRLRQAKTMGLAKETKDALARCMSIAPASDWKREKLPNVYEITNGISKGREAFGEGVPILETRAVVANAFVPEALERIVDVSPKELDTYAVKAGDLFLNRTSETPEALACVCAAVKDRPAVFSGFLKRLRPRQEKQLDVRYAAAFFRSDLYRKQIADLTTVYTTRMSLNNQTLSNVDVYYPDFGAQRRIGEAFHALARELARVRKQEDTTLQAFLQELMDTLAEQLISGPASQAFSGKDDA